MRYDNDEDAVRESSRSSDFVEAATRSVTLDRPPVESHVVVSRFCGELCQIAEACRNGSSSSVIRLASQGCMSVDTVLRAEIVAAVLEYCYALVREYSGEQDDDDENDNVTRSARTPLRNGGLPDTCYLSWSRL